MPLKVKEFPEKNFTTLVVGDLHLTEEQVPNPNFPLWKKFKTKQFFFDKEFADWLDYQVEEADTKIELILNGDIFDFDSVLSTPDKPTYKISNFEKSRTMFSQQEKSVYKMQVIIETHPIWFDALQRFLSKGNKVVFIIGNHDLEVHFSKVQRLLRSRLIGEDSSLKSLVQFCEWFYVSHEDTHIEHGNQYDSFCVCQTPITPFIEVRGDIRVRIPFGDVVARYMVNAMGFFNPHSEENYTMSLREYLDFFFKFLLKKQPLIIWTWFYSSVIILYRSILYRFREPVIDPLTYEDRVEFIAQKSQVKPRVVRELLTLAAPSAVNSPWAVAQVLWFDRALLFLLGIFFCLQLFFIVDQLVRIKIYWILVPLMFLAPFFIFYSSTVRNRLKGSKILSGEKMRWIGSITGVDRIVFGHTHEIKHEVVGSMEHLNPGSWSPEFEDIECTRPLTRCAYIKIKPNGETREAFLNEWKNNEEIDYFSGKSLSS